MKKVLITGASGFIAKNIARVLKHGGHNVIGTSRNPAPVSSYDEVVYGVLGSPLAGVYENHEVDALVHCAYDKDEIDNMKNSEGTFIWAEQAAENNVGQQIFISSISADEDAEAPYGQKKYEVEKWFIDHNQIVFRLGLVIGTEGLFGRIISTVKKSPVIPLIDSGKTSMYPTDINTICDAVSRVVNGEKSIYGGRIWNLQHEKSVFLGDMLKDIAKQYNLFRIFVPVPFFFVSIVLALTEKLSFLNLGINTNNLKGLRQVRHKTFRSDLSLLGYPEAPMEELIKRSRE